MCTAWLAGCSKKVADPVTRSSFLLNTFVTVTLYDSEDQTILDGCMTLCSDYEKLLSKTLEGSEIYKLNHRRPGERTITVSEKTAQVLSEGLEYCRMSRGAFDITIEPLSSLWDFTGKTPHVPPEEEIEADLKKVGYENVLLDGRQVTFLNDETTIDLGAIAKGFIADQMKAYLEENGVKSAVINLGGNVLCVGKRPDGAPFKIGLQRPYATHTETVAALKIDDMSVVSSGVYERHFVENGVNYHHILDPATGYPYENGLHYFTQVHRRGRTEHHLLCTGIGRGHQAHRIHGPNLRHIPYGRRGTPLHQGSRGFPGQIMVFSLQFHDATI